MFVIFKKNLKRWLKYSNLTRRPPSPNEEIRQAMQEGLNGSDSRVGFSKKILQLHVNTSNENPNVKAKLYSGMVFEFGRVLR